MICGIMSSLLRTYAPALLSGLLLSWAFPAYHLYPLAWVALIVLVKRSSRENPWGAARHFFVAGMMFYLVVLQWLLGNIHWEGGNAVLGYVLLCVLLALFWGILGAIWTVVRQRSEFLGGACFLALLWVGMEWVQGHLFTGFPWGMLGYSQGKDLFFAQWASVVGTGFLSFVLVLVNGLAGLAWARKRLRWVRLAAAAGVVAVVHAGGAALIDEADYATEPFVAGIYQSNYPQAMKWDADYQRDMVERACFSSRRLAESESVDALFWPEALVMRPYDSPWEMERMTELTSDMGVPLLAGVTRYDRESFDNYNSTVLITPEGEVAGCYDKVHLAPFGEYVPFVQYFPWLALVSGPGGVTAGEERQVFDADGRHFGPLICFEVLFGDLAEDLRDLGADTLVVVTNLAWFGDSNVIPQELEIARLRAIEQRLPLVHVANTGVSGVFDPWGRFQVVNAVVGPSGRYIKMREEQCTEAWATCSRRVGALPVAQPGRRLLSWGPRVFPFAAMAVAGLMLLGAYCVPCGPRGESQADASKAAAQ